MTDFDGKFCSEYFPHVPQEKCTDFFQTSKPLKFETLVEMLLIST
jgi:hypothetical protein